MLCRSHRLLPHMSSHSESTSNRDGLIQSSCNVCLLDARRYAELYASISCHSMWWAWLRYKKMRRISDLVRCSRLFYYCISCSSLDPDTKQARLLWLPMYFGSGDFMIISPPPKMPVGHSILVMLLIWYALYSSWHCFNCLTTKMWALPPAPPSPFPSALNS